MSGTIINLIIQILAGALFLKTLTLAPSRRRLREQLAADSVGLFCRA